MLSWVSARLLPWAAKSRDSPLSTENTTSTRIFHWDTKLLNITVWYMLYSSEPCVDGQQHHSQRMAHYSSAKVPPPFVSNKSSSNRCARCHLSRNSALTRVQDTGKSMSDRRRRVSSIDLNRAGAALMEIVSEPDIRCEVSLAFRR